MKKDAYYFPHFSNASQDRKLRRLEKDLEIEGYGIYFKLLEVLRDQQDFKYPVEDIDLLADQFKTSESKVRVVIFNYDLFSIDENNFFLSLKLIQYMQPYLEKTERARLAARKRWDNAKTKIGDTNADANADANALLLESNSKTNAMQGKERKGKERKEEDIKGYDFNSFWSDYDKKKGDISKIKKKFNSLSESTRDEIKQHVIEYVRSTPDKQFRSNPVTYLNNKGWTDEIIVRSNHTPTTTSNQPLFHYKTNGEVRKHSNQKIWEKDKYTFSQVDCYEEIEIRK